MGGGLNHRFTNLLGSNSFRGFELSPPGKHKMFYGSIPAVITPNNQEVDYESFTKIIEFLINNGSEGLVPCGTTGESPTLSHDEHKKIIRSTELLIKEFQ